MKYRGYYIETNGKRYRCYERRLFFRFYIKHRPYCVVGVGNQKFTTEFLTLDAVKQKIDYILLKEEPHWRPVADPPGSYPYN